MSELREGSGIYIDFTSRTVTLIGTDTVDLIFTEALKDQEVDEEDVTRIALAIVAQKYPDYVDDGDGLPWSLGADEDSIDYLMSKMPASFVTVGFLTDGGPDGSV